MICVVFITVYTVFSCAGLSHLTRCAANWFVLSNIIIKQRAKGVWPRTCTQHFILTVNLHLLLVHKISWHADADLVGRLPPTAHKNRKTLVHSASKHLCVLSSRNGSLKKDTIGQFYFLQVDKCLEVLMTWHALVKTLQDYSTTALWLVFTAFLIACGTWQSEVWNMWSVSHL